MRRKKNLDVRRVLKDRRVYMWEVAERLGIHEVTLYRWFRHELPEDTKARIRSAVDEIVSARQF